MSVVLDNSDAVHWALPDEVDERADRLFVAVRTGGAVVPPLFFAEYANALLKAERRGRITSEQAQAAVALLGELPVQGDDAEPDGYVLLFLGERYGLTAYDAWYLALAITRKLPLATRDEALRSAAKAIGIELVDA